MCGTDLLSPQYDGQMDQWRTQISLYYQTGASNMRVVRGDTLIVRRSAIRVGPRRPSVVCGKQHIHVGADGRVNHALCLN